MVPEVISFQHMAVGKKGGGKHWTQGEVERRRQAAQTVTRAKPKAPKPPDWIKHSVELYSVWRRVIADAKDLELFDALDANALATYCGLEVAKRKALADEDIETFERLAKTTLQYAKSLGLTPEARARLAKKRADGDRGGDPNADLFE